MVCILHFVGPTIIVALGTFKGQKGKTVVNSILTVQQFNIPNHKTIEIIFLFWHDCGLEGHAITELVIRFSNSDKSELFYHLLPHLQF